MIGAAGLKLERGPKVFMMPAGAGHMGPLTHAGLVESHECYGVCVQGWGFYIGESLRRLIEDGAGQPATFDHRTDDQRVEVAS